ncbi:MAG: hypothetical protein COS99_00760 [Candidatus Omnitrophica bacterium CG07_land_8_20_14_0_80_42_15]|uniref:LysM domain-containing protein n=1 Tax=Candidatus Aquitaenariimonas noxiae TaxID=1974741 RepID=A0A2J0L4Y2_9BACT|nr:MAG: hypothetical protein COS99_00760 [Candidatus Omnitrophica bacterium CG07_land_8_20_14_0_80_42_15]
MKRVLGFVSIVVFVTIISGCSIKAAMVERDRVDQNISGNRGVIKGEVKPVQKSEVPPKRTYMNVDVDLKSMQEIKQEFSPKKKEPMPDKDLWGNKGSLSSSETRAKEEIRPYQGEKIEKVSVVEEAGPLSKPAPKPSATAPEKTSYIKYIVQKGDTLGTISAKPEIYGTAKKWQRIYEANRNILKDAEHIYPGQVLTIPLETGNEKPAKGTEETIK